MANCCSTSFSIQSDNEITSEDAEALRKELEETVCYDGGFTSSAATATLSKASAARSGTSRLHCCSRSRRSMPSISAVSGARTASASFKWSALIPLANSYKTTRSATASNYKLCLPRCQRIPSLPKALSHYSVLAHPYASLTGRVCNASAGLIATSFASLARSERVPRPLHAHTSTEARNHRPRYAPAPIRRIAFAFADMTFGRRFEIRENLIAIFLCHIAAAMHIDGQPFVTGNAKGHGALAVEYGDRCKVRPHRLPILSKVGFPFFWRFPFLFWWCWRRKARPTGRRLNGGNAPGTDLVPPSATFFLHLFPFGVEGCPAPRTQRDYWHSLIKCRQIAYIAYES